MSRYTSADFSHEAAGSVGVLLANLGTPEDPSVGGVRRYLRQFLGDPRVVEVPRPVWWLVLNAFILPFRPRRSAQAYQQVWTEHGSPLLRISRRQREALQAALAGDDAQPMPVALGMCYGQPSIADALRELRAQGAQRLLVLPLYPHYSGTTTGAVFDAVARELMNWRWVPPLQFIGSYHDDAGYIAALAASVREHWREHGRGEKLLLSFHGIPQAYFEQGDPYHCHCQKTARLVAETLALADDDWQVCFQSRFGPKQWLQPYLDETVAALARGGARQIDVLAPAFAADCLETLEEIAMQNEELFKEHGGERLRYIPCLNDRDDHIAALAAIVRDHAAPWHESLAAYNDTAEARRRTARAEGMRRTGTD